MQRLDLESGAQCIRSIIDDPDGMLERTLRTILEHCQGTEYGRRFGFAEIQNIGEFRQRLPVTNYRGLEPYFRRMIEGASDVLFPGPTSFVAQTSGTSGSPKLFPYPVDEARWGVERLSASIHAVEHAHPGTTSDAVVFYGRAKEAATPGGVRIGSASGYSLELLEHPFLQYLPPSVWGIEDTDTRYYVVLRLALARRVRLLCAFNPSTLLMLMDKGTLFAERLVRDLRDGSLNPPSALPPQLRAELADFLRPDTGAADRLESCLTTNGRFEPEWVWPDLKVLITWKGGMCKHYLPELQARVPSCHIFFRCLYGHRRLDRDSPSFRLVRWRSRVDDERHRILSG